MGRRSPSGMVDDEPAGLVDGRLAVQTADAADKVQCREDHFGRWGLERYDI